MTAVEPERTDLVPAPAAPRRRKVDHFFTVGAGEFSRQHGLPVRSLCGVWLPPVETMHRVGVRLEAMSEEGRVRVVDNMVTDCRRCVRIEQRRVMALEEGA